LRALGVREIASGVGLLAQPQRPMWLWTRLAGDAMDLTLLGMAFGTHRSHRGRLATATGAVGLVTALDLICIRRTSQLAHGPAEPVQLAATIVIERSREELYRFWRDLTQLPRFMRSIREVRIIDQRHSRWFAAGSDGESLSWESEITEDRPGEYIAWRSTPGSRLDTEGVVRFEPAPNGEGSLVRLQVSYRAAANAGSALGKLIATLARSEIKSELRRFKQLIETGEVATTDGQPSGRRSGLAKLLHRVRS
jgi:uncharacterized membrane protein